MADEQKPKATYPGVDETGIALRPRNFEELWKFAQMVSETDFVPSAFRGKPGAVIAACQLGNEVGLPPMTALKWIAVINGTPSIWGDGYWMLVNNHPAIEWAEELGPDEALLKGYGECTIKRKGRPNPVTRRFTIEMADKAGLWGGKGADQNKREQSPWFKYPGRMLQMRARALCGRDAIPEATGPLSMREEIEDMGPQDVTPQRERIAPPQPLAEKETDTDGKTADQEAGGDRPATDQPEAETGESGATSDQGAVASQADRLPDSGAQTKTGGVKPKPLTFEERHEWIKNASLEDLSDPTNNRALSNLKSFKQAEQVSLCRAVNDRKQALLKEQEERG